jgi:WD40 repeat protein
VAIGLRLYLWWPAADIPPEAAAPLPPVYATLPSSVACLAFDPEARYLAVGLDSGQVMAWDLVAETCCLSQASHSHPVCQVAFRADGLELLSYGLDNRIRCHRLAEGNDEPPGTPLEAGYKSSVIGIGWWGSAPCAIERTHTSDRIIWRTAEAEYALAQPAPWEQAVCSGDGQVVAGYDIGGQVVVARPGSTDRPWPTLAVAPADSDFAPQAMQLDAQGQRLLLWSDRQVELWDVAEGRSQWRFRETQPARQAPSTERSRAIDIPAWQPLDLCGSLGIPPWHQRALAT